VDQKRVAMAGFFSENARRVSVDGESEIAFGFGAITSAGGGMIQAS